MFALVEGFFGQVLGVQVVHPMQHFAMETPTTHSIRSRLRIWLRPHGGTQTRKVPSPSYTRF